MLLLKTIADLKAYLQEQKKTGRRIGFVPTMGALHRGHLSLINASKADENLTVCSIFVNPKQFNNPTDLAKYPNTLAADTELLLHNSCDVLFHPTVEEMYPKSNIDPIQYDFGTLAKDMEGVQRPGHFQGVAIVVKRLFEIVEPEDAYFGQKDYQQALVVKQLVKDYSLPVNIKVCPIVRESDGLAMSSRNVRLQPEERKIATRLWKTLQFISERFPDTPPKQLQRDAREFLSNVPGIEIEYLSIVDGDTLVPIDDYDKSDNIVTCLAAQIGNVHLLDNIILKSVPL